MSHILQSIEVAMMSPATLNPHNLTLYLRSIGHWGLQCNVAGMIHRYYRKANNKIQRAAYMSILNDLLRTPSYREEMLKVVVEVFVETYLQADREKNVEEKSLLRLLRKSWKDGTVPATQLERMRAIIWSYRRLDI